MKLKESKNALSLHIRVHCVSKEEYYTRYIDSRVSCISCGSPVKFINLIEGYSELCVTCKQKEFINKIDEYWSSEDGINRKSTNRKRLIVSPMSGGRTKGSKNKNKYPLTDDVLERFANQVGKLAPHNRDESKINKCKETWANKSIEEMDEKERKRRETLSKNCTEIAVDTSTPFQKERI